MSQMLPHAKASLATAVAPRNQLADQPARMMSKLLIVDDHALVRVGIVTSLGAIDNANLQLLEASTLTDRWALTAASRHRARAARLTCRLPCCKA